MTIPELRGKLSSLVPFDGPQVHVPAAGFKVRGWNGSKYFEWYGAPVMFEGDAVVFENQLYEVSRVDRNDDGAKGALTPLVSSQFLFWAWATANMAHATAYDWLNMRVTIFGWDDAAYELLEMMFNPPRAKRLTAFA